MEAVVKRPEDGPLPRFSEHTAAIASEGAAGWAIADAAADALARGEDVVSLCLGDTSFDTPERILEAAIGSLRGGRTHYAPVPGTPELRSSIAAAQRRFDTHPGAVVLERLHRGEDRSPCGSLLSWPRSPKPDRHVFRNTNDIKRMKYPGN